MHNFLLSGKCAGGSGRILQVIAKVLQVKVEEIGELSLKSKKRVEFNTGCAVFAESEAISRLSQEVTKEDLLAGIHRALAAQINSLAERIGVEQDVAMVGGGSVAAALLFGAFGHRLPRRETFAGLFIIVSLLAVFHRFCRAEPVSVGPDAVVPDGGHPGQALMEDILAKR
jgi:hypothetical protein